MFDFKILKYEILINHLSILYLYFGCGYKGWSKNLKLPPYNNAKTVSVSKMSSFSFIQRNIDKITLLNFLFKLYSWQRNINDGQII